MEIGSNLKFFQNISEFFWNQILPSNSNSKIFEIHIPIRNNSKTSYFRNFGNCTLIYFIWKKIGFFFSVFVFSVLYEELQKIFNKHEENS